MLQYSAIGQHAGVTHRAAAQEHRHHLQISGPRVVCQRQRARSFQIQRATGQLRAGNGKAENSVYFAAEFIKLCIKRVFVTAQIKVIKLCIKQVRVTAQLSYK
jgi:hypothetical protein